jgi:hypothetical protein
MGLTKRERTRRREMLISALGQSSGSASDGKGEQRKIVIVGWTGEAFRAAHAEIASETPQPGQRKWVHASEGIRC